MATLGLVILGRHSVEEERRQLRLAWQTQMEKSEWTLFRAWNHLEAG